MKKILLAPNSFKECAYSTEVADILGRELGKRNNLIVSKLPISDGGDGFLNVCCQLFKLNMLTFTVSTLYGNEKIKVRVGYSEIDRTLYIESAEVIGLKLIPKEKRHPLLLNTKGLGELLQSVMESGLNVDKVIIGVGGTGTSDLGLGLCSVFGLKLYDLFGNEADIIPGNYFSIKKLEWKNTKLPFNIEVITDVDNPLLGENGAVRTFAEQKGATKGEIDVLELGFDKIIKLFVSNGLIDSSEKLNGAGGGLAAGLQIFFNANLIKSRDFINRMFSDNVKELAPDFVLTGEGSFDKQSLMSKGAMVVIENCMSRNIPVFLVCGKIDQDSIKVYGDNVIPIELQSFFRNKQESIDNFEKGLEFASEQIINYIFTH